MAVIGGSVLLFIILGGIYDIGNQWLNSIICFPIGMICFHQKQKRNKLTIKTDILLILIFVVSFTSIYLVGAILKEPVNLQHRIQLLCQILCSTAFSILLIRFVSLVNVKFAVLSYIGTNSLSVYLYHLYLLALLSFVPNVGAYIVLVVLGTILLTITYNQLSNRLLLSKKI